MGNGWIVGGVCVIFIEEWGFEVVSSYEYFWVGGGLESWEYVLE